MYSNDGDCHSKLKYVHRIACTVYYSMRDIDSPNVPDSSHTRAPDKPTCTSLFCDIAASSRTSLGYTHIQGPWLHHFPAYTTATTSTAILYVSN